MTKEQQEYVYALKYFGFEIKELTQRELDIVFSAYNQKLNPKLTVYEEYKNGYEYNVMLKYYNLLSDIRKTNDVINSILNPKTEEIKPEILDQDEFNKSFNNEEKIKNEERIYNSLPKTEILDRPSPISIILSILLPIYGILISIFSWKITPKSAKWYLVFAIIGMIINMSFYVFTFLLI